VEKNLGEIATETLSERSEFSVSGCHRNATTVDPPPHHINLDLFYPFVTTKDFPIFNIVGGK
jgi:hypothetical protein